MANRVRGWILGDNTPDSGCGIKVFFRDAFLELPAFHPMHAVSSPRTLPGGPVRTCSRSRSGTGRDSGGGSHYGTFGSRPTAGVIDLARECFG